MKTSFKIVLWRIPLLTIGFVLIWISGSSQCKTWNWPADSAKAQEMVVLTQDAIKFKTYRQAVQPLQWLLKNAPGLNVSVYIWGVQVYDELAKKEEHEVRQKELADSILLIYDLRAQYCGDLINVTNRKAISFFKYNINGAEPEKVLSVMDETFKANGDQVLDELLVPYMEAIVVTQLRRKTLDEDQILYRYDVIAEVLEHKLSQYASDKARVSKLTGYKKRIEELLLKVVEVDCEFVHARLEPVYREHPDSVLTRKIFYYLLKGNCTNDSLWVETGEAIFDSERGFGLAKNLAFAFMKFEDPEKAQQYFVDALELAPTAADSVEMLVRLGDLANSLQQRTKAREMYRRAIQIDAQNADAHTRIGDLYFNSFSDCSSLQSQADDRLVYLVAYDYYERAHNSDKMKLAMKQFPSREEIFLKNYKLGTPMKVGCWIDEMTVLRTRD